MKIFNYGKRLINWATGLLQSRSPKLESMPKLLDSDIKIKPQPVADIFEENLVDIHNIKLDTVINQGRDAIVYQIRNNPNLVIRLEFDSVFNPQKLDTANADLNRHIIAASDDGTITLMRRVKGKPLHGKYWHIMQDINWNDFLGTINEIKEIPDSAFVKYYRDILELRKKGYNVDTINPNNILYDKETKTFNIVDITQNEAIKPEVSIKDFYPFVDAARLEYFYKDSTDIEQEIISTNVCAFLDRIAKIGHKIGVDLSMPKAEASGLQKFVVYLYNGCPDLVK